jgi:crossover junction endodeoxyribonuclease RusA
MIAFDVLGTPAPKGSARAFYKAGMKRAVIVKDNDARQKNWDGAVREAAAEIVGNVEAPPFVDRPLVVSITFRMARTAGHWGKGKNAGRLKPTAPLYPQTKPDIDKLARATLDALTGIVFDDDSRIARLELFKVYAQPGDEGARITVGELAHEKGVAI